jgi:hypothetical protein
MNTDQLIAMLATNAPPVEPGALGRRYTLALAGGLAGATVLMTIFLGVRPDLAAAATLPMFWAKAALPLALLVISVVGAARLSHPGVALGGAAPALAIPVVGIWALSAVVLLAAPQAERGSLLFGETWSSCPFNIAMLSVPAFVATFWAIKGFAPTRLALAGALSGLLAGATGALVYCLHCPEMAAPFLGAWYVLGMAIPAVIGSVAGPRLLRW